MRRLLVPAALILLAPLSSASALSVIDQVNPYADSAGFEPATDELWQQEVAVGVEGFLAGVDLFWTPRAGTTVIGANNVMEFSINEGPALQTDANDLEMVVTFTSPYDWNLVDVSSVGLYFEPGDTFVIGGQNSFDNTSLGGSSFDRYPAGDLYLDGNPVSNGLFDLAFRTHMNPIPEPGTGVLLAVGLAGLAAAGRRRSHTKLR